MKQVRKTVLLWYSTQEMYDLVTGVEAYPQFLPWCESAQVLERHEDGVTARLSLAYMGVRHAFTTRNHDVFGSSVNLTLVDGPFSLLEGSWRFSPLGAAQAGAPETKACKIDFEMRYAFSSRPLEIVVSPVFDKIANTLVDSFVKRAESVYGPR
jgi:ribosome-associated toxin RatA of RatAB toxin-antitoxin module